MNIVAIIPARGGSVRIPRKNVRHFHGKPIISYSISAAKESKLFSRVVVSTEDEEIADVAQDYGADVLMRPRRLADDDNVGTQQVTAHALRLIPCDYACCIYPCAPLLTPADLRAAYEQSYGTPWNYVYAEGIFYFGTAKRFINDPDDFSHSLQMKDERFVDINTDGDWRRAEDAYALLYAEAACAS